MAHCRAYRLPFAKHAKAPQLNRLSKSAPPPHEIDQALHVDPTPFLHREAHSHFSTITSLNMEPETDFQHTQNSLQFRKSELESRFDRKLYKFYVIWLYILMGLSVAQLFHSIAYVIVNDNIAGFIATSFCSFWMFLQCNTERKAIQTRDPTKARQGFFLMLLFLPVIVFTMVLLMGVKRRFEEETEGEEHQMFHSLLLLNLYEYGVLFVVHVAINICMAVKVKGILTRMETIEYVYQENLKKSLHEC